MGEIRFVGTGETRGYPYLVCKKAKSSSCDLQTVRVYVGSIATRCSELHKSHKYDNYSIFLLFACLKNTHR